MYYTRNRGKKKVILPKIVHVKKIMFLKFTSKGIRVEGVTWGLLGYFPELETGHAN